MKRNVFYTLVAIIAILGILVAAIVGAVLNNFILFLIIILAAFFLALPYFALGAIIGELETIRITLGNVFPDKEEEITTIPQGYGEEMATDAQDYAVNKEYEYCPLCGQKLAPGKEICKNCGWNPLDNPM